MPITPGYVVDYEGGLLTVCNFDGEIVTYPDGTAP